VAGAIPAARQMHTHLPACMLLLLYPNTVDPSKELVCNTPQHLHARLSTCLGCLVCAQGGLFLMVLGAAAATARLLFDAGMKVAWRQLVITAEVSWKHSAQTPNSHAGQAVHCDTDTT
jgi:hypothetical protein